TLPAVRFPNPSTPTGGDGNGGHSPSKELNVQPVSDDLRLHSRSPRPLASGLLRSAHWRRASARALHPRRLLALPQPEARTMSATLRGGLSGTRTPSRDNA